MPRLAAIVVVVISSSLPASAEEPHARFEFMAGVTPFGCSDGCGVAATPPFVDVGWTGWTSGGVGLSMKVRDVFGGVYGIFLEPSLRLRGFVGEHGDREIDFGVGFGVFPPGQYNHAWTVGMSVGFRTHERVGVRVGGELFSAFKGSGNRDGALLLAVTLVFRPWLGGRQ